MTNQELAEKQVYYRLHNLLQELRSDLHSDISTVITSKVNREIDMNVRSPLNNILHRNITDLLKLCLTNTLPIIH